MARRLLWALNHRTLMPDEVGILRSLGWAVYTPRIVPRGARSSIVEPELDPALELPAGAADVLNAHPFYERRWSPTLTSIFNRYVDVGVTAYYPSCYVSAVRHFAGTVISRVFGREGNACYADLVRSWGLADLEAAESAMGERLVFGEATTGLADVEPPSVATRAVTLPLPPPGWVQRAADTWTGGDSRLQFVCPSINSHPYYGAIYRTIKANFGDLPHVIFGKQPAPVDDPCVSPPLSDDGLIALYARSSAFLYLSPEPRHLHYSPIEAMTVGTPVLYLRDSRIDRESGGTLAGACADLVEMRDKACRLLAKDATLAEQIRIDQRKILSRYRRAASSEAWRELLNRVPRKAAA